MNRWRIDDRCSDAEQDIINKALQLHHKFVETERKESQKRIRKKNPTPLSISPPRRRPNIHNDTPFIVNNAIKKFMKNNPPKSK